LKKQQQIDRLREENARLKERLRYQERNAREGAFGSSTPSSKIPIKPGVVPDQPPRWSACRSGSAVRTAGAGSNTKGRQPALWWTSSRCAAG
jgi:hypothetical protein